jgi:FkbM family methyltransferase
MNLLTPLRRPEYLYRPQQILRRLRFALKVRKPQQKVLLPWGMEVNVNTSDRWISRALLKTGLDDLPLCEILWRLLRPHDIAVDVGANIGMTASLMLTRVGSCGSVHAFEPHPRSFHLLQRNARLWGNGRTPSNLYLHPYALGRQNGIGRLEEAEPWELNSGGVSVKPVAPESRPIDGQFVEIARLDDLFEPPSKIHLLKVDVEGRQDDVLLGAHDLLRDRRVRHLVFEVPKQITLPYATTDWLEALGYQCFVIDREFRGPLIRRVSPGTAHVRGHATNIFASVDLASATRLFKQRSWRCLTRSEDEASTT